MIKWIKVLVWWPRSEAQPTYKPWWAIIWGTPWIVLAMALELLLCMCIGMAYLSMDAARAEWERTYTGW